MTHRKKCHIFDIETGVRLSKAKNRDLVSSSYVAQDIGNNWFAEVYQASSRRINYVNFTIPDFKLTGTKQVTEESMDTFQADLLTKQESEPTLTLIEQLMVGQTLSQQASTRNSYEGKPFDKVELKEVNEVSKTVILRFLACHIQSLER
mmetsp:Transcript_41592/g.63463  ORF Transcript_41592/g.63463 Transcript_41592/m.63463 type:complete len:149 (+) Transcript_41592:534-980(+)